MDRKKLLGREGEAEAARYLERKGYKILGLNYSCRYGEIDVIAEKGGYAAIVEVKMRESAVPLSSRALTLWRYTPAAGST